MHVRVCMYGCICVRVHVYICAHVCMYVYLCMCACVCVCTCVCVHACMYMFIVSMCVCMCMNVHDLHVKVRRQFAEVSSLIPYVGPGPTASAHSDCWLCPCAALRLLFLVKGTTVFRMDEYGLKSCYLGLA